MKKISQKEFFGLLINGRSAKLGAPVYQGRIETSDTLAEELLKNAGEKKFRSVTHQQSNALMFDDESWFFYSKPKNCESRTAYRHDLTAGKVVLTLVDYRPTYTNGFGTPISEQTMILAYELEA